METSFRDTFLKAVSAMGLSLAEEQIKAYETYMELVLSWNQKMNLTAITEEKEFIFKHFVDCLLILQAAQEKGLSFQGKKVIDVGTGAGFPGIPLKIAEPTMELVLLDSLKKRTVFLQEAVNTLGLTDTTVIWDRAETAGHRQELRSAFDFCVSRAVAPLPILLEYTIPFIKPGGYLISQKGAKGEEEKEGAQKALSILQSEVKAQKNTELPVLGDKRVILLIQKKGEISSKYPRNVGKPEKNPL